MVGKKVIDETAFILSQIKYNMYYWFPHILGRTRNMLIMLTVWYTFTYDIVEWRGH